MMKRHWWFFNFVIFYLVPTLYMGYIVVIPGYFSPETGVSIATLDWNLKTGIYAGFTACWVGAFISFLFSAYFLKKSLIEEFNAQTEYPS